MDHHRHRVVVALALLVPLLALAGQGVPVYTDTPAHPIAGAACTGSRVRIESDTGRRWCCVASAWADCDRATGSAPGSVQLTGDLAGAAVSPQVTATHLASPLPEAQGGSGAATLGEGTVTPTGGSVARAIKDVIQPMVLPASFDVVVEGDSIAAAAPLPPGSRWSDLIANLSQFKGRIVTNTNVALGGATIASITADYATQVYPLRPAVAGRPVLLFVAVATNDLNDGGAGAAAVYASVQAYWATAKADGFTVVAFTVIPRPVTRTGYIEAYNTLVRSGTGYDYLVEPDRVLGNFYNSAFYLAGDTTHPNAAGHVLLAQAINAAFGGREGMRDPFTGRAPAAGFTCHPTGLGLATGAADTSCGYEAAKSVTTGSNVTAIGSQAAYTLTTGSTDTAVGTQALYRETTGSDNVAVGSSAAFNQAGGSSCTSVGASAALTATTPLENTSIGYKAAYSATTARTNTAVGSTAAYSGTTGGYNTSVGAGALYANTTGASNTAIGESAGRYQADGATALVPGTSVYIGRLAKGLDNSDSNSIVVGTAAVGEGANTTVIGTSSTIKTHVYGVLQVGAAGSPTISFGAAAPVAGTWIQGSRVFNSAAAVGQPKGWVCTVGGTPGTWVSEGNL